MSRKLVAWALAALSPFVFSIDRLVPKRRNLWVFGVGQVNQWQGNSQAIFDAVIDRPDIEVIAVARRAIPDSLDPVRDRVAVGWKSLWPLLRAGVIVVHHGRGDLPFLGISRRGRQVVNVWHGTLFKGVLHTGWDRPNRRTLRTVRTQTRLFSSTIASSDIDRLAMSASMRLPLGDTWITGLPRNDWLLVKETALPSHLRDALDRLRVELAGRILVLYAPTFRDKGSGVYQFTEAERAALGRILSSHGAVLGVRAHMNDSEDPELTAEKWALDISPLRFPETQSVLRLTDVLVSDYSSIWIDYLLLDRPIIGFIHDLAEYKSTRRILYDIERIYGGPLVPNASRLLAELDLALARTSQPEHERFRAAASRAFHRYRDMRATERTIRRILGEQGTDGDD